MQSGEEVVLLGAQPGVDRRSRRKDARHLAPDDLLGELRILHLVADRDAVAFSEQSREVALGGVVGNAAHGHGPFLVPGRELDLQFARGYLGVVVEEFVEVAHPEKEQGVGMLPLGRRELAHDRGERSIG